MSTEATTTPTPKSGRKPKPYLARKASAQEIRETLGVTEADRRLVNRIMVELGFVKPDAATRPHKAKLSP